MNRFAIRRVLLTALVFCGGAATTAVAERITQVHIARPQGVEPKVLSGSDVGFRVDSRDRNGVPVGALMVKVDGEWVEARFSPVIRGAAGSK